MSRWIRFAGEVQWFAVAGSLVQISAAQWSNVGKLEALLAMEPTEVSSGVFVLRQSGQKKLEFQLPVDDGSTAWIWFGVVRGMVGSPTQIRWRSYQ